ncbi:HET-domain-containing protein, partial [Lepidopterella palustris CBS 459.81]
EIRLLELGTTDSQPGPLTCQLRVFSRNKAPSYSALSYTWGGQEPNVWIIVNGRWFAITPKLNSFLRQAVRHTRDAVGWRGGYLWVDSVCINQKDNREKSEQVRFMKQIYEQAEKTLVWLGHEPEETKYGFEVMDNWGKDTKAFGKDLAEQSHGSQEIASGAKESAKIIPEERNRKIRGLLTLTSRESWRRVWIIQEATAAKSADATVIWCGPFFEQLDKFISAATFLLVYAVWYGRPGMLHDESAEALRTISAIKKRRRDENVRIDPYSVLPYTSLMRASDPRDKIYALMPLTIKSAAEVFTPNYDLPARDLFISVAEYMIYQDQNLNVLGLSGGTRNVDVPTWMPDWTSSGQAKAFRRYHLSQTGEHEPLYQASTETKFHGRIDRVQGLLHVRGIIYDEVYSKAMTRTTSKDADDDVEHDWKARTLIQWSRYKTGCSWHDALPHTVCADTEDPGAGTSHGYTGDPALGKRDVSVEIPPYGEYRRLFDTIPTSIRDATIHRCLLKTRKGFISLGPADTEKDDFIFIIDGCQFPLILRVSHANWKLVGEAYIKRCLLRSHSTTLPTYPLLELPDKHRHRCGTMLTWAAPVGGHGTLRTPRVTSTKDGPSSNIRREMENICW